MLSGGRKECGRKSKDMERRKIERKEEEGEEDARVHRGRLRETGGEGSPWGSDYLMKQQMLHQQYLSMEMKAAVSNWMKPPLSKETIRAQTHNRMTLNSHAFSFTKKEILTLCASPCGPHVETPRIPHISIF